MKLKIPEIAESITEVQIGEWLKEEGDAVEKDEAIATLESEKATVELPAPSSGTLSKILRKPGETVKIGEDVAEISGDGEEPKDGDEEDTERGDGRKHGRKSARRESREEDEENEEVEEPGAGKGAPRRGEARRDEAEDEGAERGRRGGKSRSAEGAQDREEEGEDAALAAEVRRKQRAAEREEAAAARPTAKDSEEAGAGEEGEGGGEETEERRKPRIVQRGTKEEPQAREGKEADAEKKARREGKPPSREKAAAAKDEEEAVRMSPLRRAVAKRLVAAQREAALLTTFNEADCSAMQALRRGHGPAFEKRHGVKLGLMPFFVRAAIEALKEFPGLNAEVRGEEIVYKRRYDVGVAVSTEKGLVVPVLRGAERMSFAEMESAIGELARKAREGRIGPGELEGGTFTITNGGVFGSLLSTPIVNPPQTGVLGLHRIEDRPRVVLGQVLVRPMMYLALTYDHRAVDGREAVSFLDRVKAAIEEPARILLEV